MDRSSQAPAETGQAPRDDEINQPNKPADMTATTPGKPESHKSRSSSPQSETQECEICYFPYDKDRKPRPCTRCKKSFCKECWTTWELTQPKINGDRPVTCPNCRQVVAPLDSRASPKHARPFSHGQPNVRARQRMDRRRSGVNHMLPQRHQTHSGSMYGPFLQLTNHRNTPWMPAPTGFNAPTQYHAGYYGPPPSAPPGFQYGPPQTSMNYHPTPTMMHNSPALYNTNPATYGPPNPQVYQPPLMIRPSNHYAYGFSPPTYSNTLPGPQYPQAQTPHSVTGHPCPAMNGSAWPSTQTRSSSIHQLSQAGTPRSGQVPHHLPPRPQPPADNNFHLPPPVGMFSTHVQHTYAPSQQGLLSLRGSVPFINTEPRSPVYADAPVQALDRHDRQAPAYLSVNFSRPRPQAETNEALNGSDL